jgi:hypothetical protein
MLLRHALFQLRGTVLAPGMDRHDLGRAQAVNTTGATQAIATAGTRQGPVGSWTWTDRVKLAPQSAEGLDAP